MKRNKVAFTLAEVLVTLGIIGVVAALTVPNLMQNYQRQAYVTQLHKFYSDMENALRQVMTEDRAQDLTETRLRGANDTTVATFLKDNFKIVNDCGGSAIKAPCFNVTDYKIMNGTAFSNLSNLSMSSTNVRHCVTLAGGEAVCMSEFSGNADTGYGKLIVDTNGTKGPNVVGRDLFVMFYYSDGVLDDVNMTPLCRRNNNCISRNTTFGSCNSINNNLYGCFGKILNDNWEMKY